MRNHLILFLLASSLFSLQAQNLLMNGDFELGVSQWNNVAYNGGSANYSVESSSAPEGNNFLQAEINALGTNPWSVQSVHAGLSNSLTINSKYTLSFYAKSNLNENTLQVVLQEGGIWQAPFKRTLTKDWKKYVIHFKA